jgi:succinyl-diaminopimelate desuccinylase
MTVTAVDTAWLESTLLQLLNTDTGVPTGQTEVEPGEDFILEAMNQVVRPLVDSLRPDEVRVHPAGDLAARFGPPGRDGLLIQTYIVSQHGNLMDEPQAARVVDGAPFGLVGPTAVGQGANQNKGPMAAVLAALMARPDNLSRPVWLTVNTEGRSSHGGSRRLLEELEVHAAQGVVSIGTDLRVSIGNRGRVDVRVTVQGESCHSSQPWLGSNPIEVAADVIAALRSAPIPAKHPELGPASVTPYQVANFPIAPHTIPSRSEIVIDRRLLPNESAHEAVESLRDHLLATVAGTFSVEEGVLMLPAQVSPDLPVVLGLIEAVREAGAPSEAFWSLNTFDAGLACQRDIPTCMFGPGKRSFSSGVTAAEAVTLADCNVAAAALQRVMSSLCG